MFDKGENRNFIISFVGGILVGLLISVTVFGFLMILERPLDRGVEANPSIFQVRVIEIFEKNVTEKVEILDKNIVEIGEVLFVAAALKDIYIKFYNLSIDINYTFVSACCFNYDFNGSSEITVVMVAYEGNWCGLVRENEGIIGIFIESVI